jgi:nicotinate-nucleotide adenylyltransferase
MRLGIFGGTFDPIHYGHLLLAECCREQLGLDRVWFLPAAVPPHKQQRELAPGALRVEMIELAIGGHEAFEVCRHEIDRGGINYTVETLAHLRKQDPARELFFLMGADSLRDLRTWRQPDQICRLAMPVVVRRAGDQPQLELIAPLVDGDRLDAISRHQVDMPRIDLTSSDLRSRVGRGLSIRYRTPRSVERFIESHGLYGSEASAAAQDHPCSGN